MERATQSHSCVHPPAAGGVPLDWRLIWGPFLLIDSERIYTSLRMLLTRRRRSLGGRELYPKAYIRLLSQAKK